MVRSAYSVQEYGFQGLLQWKIPEADIRIGGKRTGLEPSVGTDMNESPSCRQAASVPGLIPGKVHE
jgi:hypothetical protein